MLVSSNPMQMWSLYCPPLPLTALDFPVHVQWWCSAHSCWAPKAYALQHYIALPSPCLPWRLISPYYTWFASSIILSLWWLSNQYGSLRAYLKPSTSAKLLIRLLMNFSICAMFHSMILVTNQLYAESPIYGLRYKHLQQTIDFFVGYHLIGYQQTSPWWFSIKPILHWIPHNKSRSPENTNKDGRFRFMFISGVNPRLLLCLLNDSQQLNYLENSQ